MTSTLTTDIGDHISVCVEYECDPVSVTVVSAVVSVVCLGACRGDGWFYDGYHNAVRIACPACKGSGKQHADILPTLTPAELSKLKEECAADGVTEHGLED